MKFKAVTGGAIPVGNYVGRFLGVTPQDTTSASYRPQVGKNGDELPPGVVWAWRIVGGEHDGEVADRLTGPTCTPKSECTQLAEVLTGERWGDGVEFDPDQAIGTLWRFRVDPRDGSPGTRVSIRGLARAFDLEQAEKRGEKVDRPPPGKANGHVYVIFGGRKHAEPLSVSALVTAVKAHVVQLTDPAGLAGDERWGTIRDVLPRVLPTATVAALVPE